MFLNDKRIIYIMINTLRNVSGNDFVAIVWCAKGKSFKAS